MLVRDIGPVASGAKSEGRSAFLAAAVRRDPTPHKGHDCGFLGIKCICSFATNNPWVPEPWSSAARSGCVQVFPATQTTGPDQTTHDAPAASFTPSPTSSLGLRSTNATSRTPTPTPAPGQTATGSSPTSHAFPSPSLAPTTSSAPADGNAKASDRSLSLTPSPAVTGNASPTPPDPHPLNTRAIVGIVLGALSLFLVIALALFLLLRRRARRTAKRMSNESSWRRLRVKAHPFDDGASGFISSVWTGFGSVSVDPDFDPRRELAGRRHSLGFRFAEKEKDADPARFGLGAYTSGPSPPPKETTRPLASNAPSVHLPHEGQPVPRLQLNVPILPSSGLEVSSSATLLALAGTGYHVSKRGDGALEREGSEASHTTTTSGNVQSMEAL